MEKEVVDVNGRKYFRPPQTEEKRASSCTSRSRCSVSDRTMEKALAAWAIEQFPCLCGANRKPNH